MICKEMNIFNAYNVFDKEGDCVVTFYLVEDAHKFCKELYGTWGFVGVTDDMTLSDHYNIQK